MEKFYLIEEDKQVGPFTIDELRQKNIRPNSLLWYDSLHDWTEAKYIEALKDHIRIKPPPIPTKNVNIIKDEAEIEQKPSNPISINTKVIFAKEIIVVVKLFLLAIGISILSYPIYFANEDGFGHMSLYDEWKFKYDNGSREDSIALAPLYQKSSDLGWGNYLIIYGEANRTPEFYHKYEYEKASDQAFYDSFGIFILAAFALIGGRYIIKSISWVILTSNRVT